MLKIHFNPSNCVICRTATKVLFLYFNFCLSVMLDSLSCLSSSISFLTNGPEIQLHVVFFTYFYILTLNYFYGCRFSLLNGTGSMTVSHPESCVDFCVLTFVSVDDRHVLIVLTQFYYIYLNASHMLMTI